jgi:hypothetical protein
MKFYQNKTTGEIIGVKEMLELIDHPTELSNRLGFNGYSRKTIYKAILPNKILGNGIDSFCISHTFLLKNYKRIRKEIAFDKYPNFEQYKHRHMVIEAERLGVDGFEVLTKQTI